MPPFHSLCLRLLSGLLVVLGACQQPASQASTQAADGLSLAFKGTPSVATLQALAASDRLQELRIWDDGEGMGMASDHPARLGNEHLAIIAGIDSLEHLTIGGWDMAYDDQGLAVLSRLGRLKSLNLSQSQGITDRGMAYLADFPALEALDISYTNISDVGLEALLAAPHLKHLDYGWAAAADASLARFEAAYPEAPFLQP